MTAIGVQLEEHGISPDRGTITGLPRLVSGDHRVGPAIQAASIRARDSKA